MADTAAVEHEPQAQLKQPVAPAAPAQIVRPDGGYGWIVVMASFVAHFVCLGEIYSFGVLFVALLDDDSLDGNRSSTAWIGSLVVGIMLFTSIFVGHMIPKFGCRAVALCGGGIVCTGLLLAAWGTKLWHLYLTFGFIVGVGFGCSFVPAVAIVSMYFVKKRAMATGIAVAGSGVGTFVMALITRALLDHLTWRSTLRVHAAIATLLFVCAASYRPLRAQAGARVAPSVEPSVASTEGASVGADGVAGGDVEMAVPQGADQDGDSSDLAPLIDAPADATNDASLAGGGDGDGNGDDSALLHAPTAPQGAPEGSIVAVADGQQMEATSADSNKLPGSFVFMVVSAQFMAFGYGTPFVHLVKYAEESGLTPAAAASILSIIGIASTIGRVVFGRLADHRRVNRLHLYKASMLIVGAAELVLPLFQTYATLVVFALVFGTLAGSFIAIMPVVTADVVGDKNFARALGYVYGCQLVSALIGPPVGGLLFNVTGSYTVTWIVAGASVIIGSLLLFPVKTKPRRHAS